ncbi:hypothetical protein NKDENANG_03032 [Candidatus Entotheonellaceae bacterium PAL068K]
MGLQSGGRVGNSYATGTVIDALGDRDRVGGLVGMRHAGVTIADSYWDIDTSGLLVGVGEGSSEGVMGQTTAALQAPTSNRRSPGMLLILLI